MEPIIPPINLAEESAVKTALNQIVSLVKVREVKTKTTLHISSTLLFQKLLFYTTLGHTFKLRVFDPEDFSTEDPLPRKSRQKKKKLILQCRLEPVIEENLVKIEKVLERLINESLPEAADNFVHLPLIKTTRQQEKALNVALYQAVGMFKVCKCDEVNWVLPCL